MITAPDPRATVSYGLRLGDILDPAEGPYHAGVTIRLASDGPQTVRADTIGAAWLAVAGRILAEGIEAATTAWRCARSRW